MNVGFSGKYCKNSDNNMLVIIDGVYFYFSYRTIIAFKIDGKLFIRENDWAQTTGKHLNAIDCDKSIRIKGEEFEKLLGEMHVKICGELVRRLGA